MQVRAQSFSIFSCHFFLPLAAFYLGWPYGVSGSFHANSSLNQTKHLVFVGGFYYALDYSMEDIFNVG